MMIKAHTHNSTRGGNAGGRSNRKFCIFVCTGMRIESDCFIFRTAPLCKIKVETTLKNGATPKSQTSREIYSKSI